jgi:diguanylate cyclase (GGDEF)-like protein
MIHLLVVEDQPDMRRILKNYLVSKGFEVTAVDNGLEAVSVFEDGGRNPDLVLMDIMMPEMGGIEATRKIRQLQNDSYTPIIMLTAKKETEDVVEGLEAGGDDYITKPFSFDELMARIKSALRIKEVQTELIVQKKEIEAANNKINHLNIALLEQNRENRKRIYQQHNLFKISNDLHSHLNIDDLIRVSLLTFLGQFSCKNALLMLDKKKDQRIVKYEVIRATGYFPEEVKDYSIEASSNLVNYFQDKGRPTHLDKVIKALGPLPELVKMEKWGLRVIAPLIRHNELDGLVFIGERVSGNERYSETELEMLAILNNMLIIAIHNANLYEQVLQISYTDGMTKLHNFRYFEFRLAEEISRAIRNKTGLSLIILDVDWFKNYNDTLGHPAGDELLRQLARALKETVRDNDIVARYGGEEFAVILPSVEKDGAMILAERLRKRVEEEHFPNEEVQPRGRLTISLGLASLPEDADTKENLIRRADKALYEAKRAGRNQVHAYDTKLGD